jgi:hypothetical protein
MSNTCKICGTDISAMRKEAKICRDIKCQRTRKNRRAAVVREKAREGRVCLICGVKLGKVQKKYCGDTCYKMAKSQRGFAARTKHLKAVHKMPPKPKAPFVIRPDDFSHAKFKAAQKDANQANGWKCTWDGCGKPLMGPNRYFCEYHRGVIKHSGMGESGYLGDGGDTGGRTSAMGAMG